VSRPWQRVALALAVGLSAAHFYSFPLFESPIVTDIRYYLYHAWQVTEGAVLHRDLFGVKTQLASFTGALLYALAEGFGVTPLFAIRAGYLLIAAAGGVLAFEIFRRLGRGRSTAGLLGAIAYCAFGLMGALPATGNVPKLLMCVLASAMGLLVQGRHWFWAGVAGALAFMDWQPGALVGLAALLSALLFGRPVVGAALRVVAGVLAGLAPFALYYALQGALAPTLQQILIAPFLRGAESRAGGAPGAFEQIQACVGEACPGYEWLFYLSFVGIPVVLVWLWSRRRGEEWRLLVPLSIYHFGLVGFSLVDFQWYGDLMALLHSSVFFLAASWVALHGAVSDGLERLTRARGPTARRGAGLAVGLGFLVAAVAIARPAFLRPELLLRPPGSGTRPTATLADQRAVAEQVRHVVGNRRFAVLDSAELLFLLRHANPLPIPFFDRAVWRHYRGAPQEPPALTALNLLRDAEADVIVFPNALPKPPSLLRRYRPRILYSAGRTYSVVLWLPRVATTGAGVNLPRVSPDAKAAPRTPRPP